MSGIGNPRTLTEAVGGGGCPPPPPPPPQFLLPPPPPPVVAAHVIQHHGPLPPPPPPPSHQVLPLAVVIKSEPTSEDDFLRSQHSSCADDDSVDLTAAVAHHATSAGRKRFLDESSHDEIVKSEFGQTARVVAPSGRTVLEFDGNDQVLCRVCGDKASGFHYGVHSCEGCKGFFRRSIQQKIQYRPCTKNQQCNILRINRNRCQYCRLKKCIAAGMSRDAVRFGRVPKREKAKILAAMQSSRMKTQESKVMGELNDDAKIIDCIVRAHYDTCDYTRKKMDPFLQSAKANPKYISCSGTTCPMKGRPEDTFLEQFSERFMDHVRQVCTFAKLIPGFKCLHHDDQVTLLKSCVFEVLLVRLAGLFDSQSLVCLNGDIIRKDTINAMVPGNAKFLMDSVFELAQRLNHFRLSDAEIGLFCAVVIITPDRPGLRNPELLMRMQNKLKLVLSSILLPQHPENESIFPELMTMVHDLRTLNTLHTEKFLQQCKIDNGPPPPTSANSENNNSAFEAVSHQRWDSAHLDRESTGNGSPQSSSGGDTHSSTSLEDTSSRRSPMGSVSSTDSSTSEVSKLLSTVQDLRMNSNSVLMTALTSQPGGVTISRKTSNGQALTTHCPMAATVSTVSVTSANVNSNLNKYNNKMPTSTPQLTHPASMVRKTDSPSTDSGVESNLVLHPTSSTNNSSLCSSPRSSSEGSSSNSSSNNNSSSSSSVENSKSRSNASASPPSEERHPLLKRALQQPPQMFNNVNTFQDEVYKPHKKFRRHNNSFSKDDCPSSSTQRSSSPEAPKSLLASQLAEPPQPYHPARSSSSSSGSGSTSAAVIPNLGNAAVLHQIHHHHPPISVPASSSLLASTLSQGIPLATSEESKRNELLAQLILGDNSGGPKRIAGAAATTPTEAAVAAAAGAQRRAYQQTQPQGLLMCAATNWSSSKNKAGAASSVSATPPPASYSQQPNRHIPVATLPTKPHGSSRMQASATVTSAEAAAMQPLNLSKRIESKTHHLMTAAAASMSASNHATAGGSMPPTSVAAATTAASNGHDIPTEA